MNRQRLKIKGVNKFEEVKTPPEFGQMEEHLAYLNMDETKESEDKYFLIALLLLIVVVAFGCEDPGKDLFSKSPPQQVNSSARIASSAINRKQALNPINYLFEDEPRLIKPEQVQRIN